MTRGFIFSTHDVLFVLKHLNRPAGVFLEEKVRALLALCVCRVRVCMYIFILCVLRECVYLYCVCCVCVCVHFYLYMLCACGVCICFVCVLCV